jgi:electron transport protein HydN
MNTFVIADPNKCLGCRTCEIACVVAHTEENLFTSESSEIEFYPRLNVLKTANASGPIQCRHCEDALCAKACPNKCINSIDGIVYIDRSNCIGCKTCVMACPVGAVGLVPEINVQEKLAQQDLKAVNSKLYFKERMVGNKCDLCKGKEDGPACAKVCPTKAFKIVQTDDDIVKLL